MKHRTLDELATEAHVTSVGAESMRAVRRQRLERLASLLEVHEGALRLFSGMEYLPKSHRILMSVDDSVVQPGQARLRPSSSMAASLK
jgi:hypothetical protein